MQKAATAKRQRTVVSLAVGESLQIINSFNLSVTFSNKAGFVTFKRPIRDVFELVDPFAANWFVTSRERNKRPSIIASKGIKFGLHSIPPFRVKNCLIILGGLTETKKWELSELTKFR